MNPRLNSSTQWTSLPAELLTQIRDVLDQAFEEWLKKQPGQFVTEGRIYANELLFRIGYVEQGRLVQANFEVSLDFDAIKQNALEQIHFAVDCAGSLLQEYLDHDQDLHALPRQWQKQTIENRPVFVRFSTENTALEAEADRLLGLKSDSLVQEDAGHPGTELDEDENDCGDHSDDN